MGVCEAREARFSLIVSDVVREKDVDFVVVHQGIIGKKSVKQSKYYVIEMFT